MAIKTAGEVGSSADPFEVEVKRAAYFLSFPVPVLFHPFAQNPVANGNTETNGNTTTTS